MLLALTFLVWGITAGAARGRDRAQRQLDAASQAEAAERAKALDDYFSRARSVLLLAAQNPAFRDYYQPAYEGARSLSPALVDAVAQMHYIHSLYPDSIGEICFIDRGGAENARLVGGLSASVQQLSPDERANPFFAPTLALPVGQVLQASPYRSPDTGDLVISNSTPLVGPGGDATAMLHYEVSVASFSALIARAGGVHRVRLVDGGTGSVLSDTARPLPVGAGSSTARDVAFPGLDGLPTGDGIGPVTGARTAVVHLAVTAYNENRWAVVVDVPVASLQVGGFLNGTTLVLVVSAAMLLALAYVGSRSRRLRIVANTDVLTGLPNRRAFMAAAARALSHGARAGTRVAIAFVDLDRFKDVNDTLGHSAGDVLLQIVGERLARATVVPDALARLGGDEFAILLTDVDSVDEALERARRIADLVCAPVRVHGVTFSLEASIGVAISGHHGDDATVLLQRADAAMYSAKNDHTGIAAFHRDLEVGGPERLALLNELRNAIADKALTVHYQPKVDLRTGVVVGVEALVRWDHPRLGLVMPTTFVELAERSSLIAPLTRFVLDEALAQSRAWSAAGHVLSVAVNISSRSLGDAEFAGMVLDALARSGVPARQLVLELTESAIMTDPLTASQVLHDLHRVGVQISIDDFGTGYSSLAYLQALPLDELKIDRSFVERLDDVSGNAIVQSIIGLARNLGLRVVAEGVETERARDVLHVLDCDVGQGYLWSRAVPAGDVSSWIAERGVRPDAAAVLTA